MEENELAQAYGSPNPETNQMAAQGRNGDAMMAHVTPGDYVIPKDILIQHPEFLTKLKKVMEDQHVDYRTHMVGSGFENINPETGAPEFFGGSFGRRVGSVFRGLPVAAPVINTIAKGLNFVAKPLGIDYYSGLAQGTKPDKPSIAPAAAAAPYAPSKMALPGSLQELGGLSNVQQRSYLASQGAQGEGLGGNARDYYTNLLQNNIHDNQDATLLPVESQYLSQNGVNTSLSGQQLIDALRGF